MWNQGPSFLLQGQVGKEEAGGEDEEARVAKSAASPSAVFTALCRLHCIAPLLRCLDDDVMMCLTCSPAIEL